MPDPRAARSSDSPAVATVAVRRHGEAPGDDDVAVERPLEVRINGHPFATIMRTPGRDDDLAVGFLCSEGLLRTSDDLTRVEAVDEDSVSVVTSRGRAEAVAAALERRRPVAVSTACGVCGRPELDSLGRGDAALTPGWTIPAAVLLPLPSTLRGAQVAFARTGGLHAAALFDRTGHLVSSAEDVGRHNAVDKLLGRGLMEGRLPLADMLLLVSGRASFEIVQKAWMGGIALVAAVSAPSSFAIATAERAGITLVGFLRGDRFNVYTHAARIDGLR